MNRTLHKRHPGILWSLIGVALAFSVLLHFRPELTGNDHLNGYAGVALGLFTAAFPAANFLDMLLAELGSLHWGAVRRADLPWVILNLAVLFTGLVIVVVGTRLFYQHWLPG
ncbi:MAG TPA: hypothetical protein VMT91_11080 [Anaerolineales bacterium]|nr:hypothetical protein [Anaerolineales bacterium]